MARLTAQDPKFRALIDRMLQDLKACCLQSSQDPQYSADERGEAAMCAATDYTPSDDDLRAYFGQLKSTKSRQLSPSEVSAIMDRLHFSIVLHEGIKRGWYRMDAQGGLHAGDNEPTFGLGGMAN